MKIEKDRIIETNNKENLKRFCKLTKIIKTSFSIRQRPSELSRKLVSCSPKGV